MERMTLRAAFGQWTRRIPGAACRLSLIAGFLILSGLTAPARGEDASALFGQACDLYEKGDIEAARAAFQTIADRGIRSAAVYYNLANCYYREGHVGMAVANYRRAFLLDPGDGDIKANLDLIRVSVGGIDTTSTAGLRGAASLPLEAFSPRQVMVVFYVAYYLAAACFLGVLFLGGRPRRIGLYGLAAAVVVACCAFGLSRYNLSKFRSVSEAVVTTDKAEFKSGPGNTFEEMTTLSDGVELKVRARSGMWIEVQLPTGEIGWVKAQDTETI
jgi:tetratricopeptide (TPR) repeat protein